MPYITGRDLRQATLRGLYQAGNFVLPTDSLSPAPALAAVCPAAKGAMVKAISRRTLAGAFVPAVWNTPPYRTLGDFTSSVSGMTDWVKNNPGVAAAIGLAAAVLLLGMGGGRGRR